MAEWIANLSCTDHIRLNSSHETAIDGPLGMHKIGYYTAWSVYDPENVRSLFEIVESLGLTHLIYAFGIMDETSGGFCLHDAYAAFDKGVFSEIKAVKRKKPDFQIGLSIGGWNHRHQLKMVMKGPNPFMEGLVDFARRHEFDFIDIDWEFDSPEDAMKDQELLLGFTKLLFDEYGESPVFLTIAMSGSTRYLSSAHCFDPYVKMFHLMTYNYSGPWSSTSMPFAPLYGGESVDSAVGCLLRQGIEPKKIVIGVSGLGVEFKDQSAKDISVGCKDLKRYMEIWDEQRCATSYHISNSLVSIESARSFEEKEKYVVKLRLGGIFIWDVIGFDKLMYDHPESTNDQ